MNEIRKKVIIQASILVCLVAIFATFFFLFRKNITHQEGIISSLRSKKVLFSQSAGGILALKKQWEAAQQYTSILESYFPAKDDLILVPQELKARAQKKGVTVSFSYGADMPTVSGGESHRVSGEKGAIQFTATLEGQKVQVAEMLNELNIVFHSLRTETIDMTQLSNSIIRVSIMGKMSYYE